MIPLHFITLSLLLLASPRHLTLASPPYDASYDPHHYTPTFHRRNYITPGQQSDKYDYIIAGGGLAGLVVASKLSDDSSKTVLVLEAGPTGDDVAAKINTPATTYTDTLLGKDPYDWQYTTSPQPNAGNRSLTQPRGRVLGGSAAVNGMYIVRPSKEEINAWHDLIAPSDADAAAAWGWDSFFSTMKDTETFHPPTSDSENAAGIKYTASSRGTKGNLQTTFPGYMVPMSSRWLPTLAAAGIPSNNDAYSGSNIGGFFATSAINPANWTRSYSKSGWIDNLPPRSNLHVLAGATVERVVFDTSATRMATGVEFSTGKGTAKTTVSVNKEVLLAGGAIGSAHLLQLSGVGPRDVLEAAGVPVQVELPGVGQHFLDHLAAGVFYKTTEDTSGSIHASGSDLSKTPEFNSFINDAVAYVNGSMLFDGDASFATFRGEIASSFDQSAKNLVPSQYPEVVEGYKAIYKTVSEKIHPTAGLVEILFSINAAGQVAVQAALQQALSQGRMYIASSSVYDKPTIDPGYFSHPADVVILRQGIRLARKIAATPPLSEILGDEVTPGASIQSDADVENFLRTTAGTEYHPGGTCAMLPKAQGGVVDGKLRVYGTGNVRVVDSSVFPISFAAHLMSVTYGVAERAAVLVGAGWNGTVSANGTSSGSGGTSGGDTGTKKGAASALKVGWMALAVGPAILAALL